MKTSSNVVGDSNDENNFPYKFLLADTQVSWLRKDFANNFSANIKLSKTRLRKIGQSGECLGRLLGPLWKTGLPFIGNVLSLVKRCKAISINSSSISNRCSCS